MLIFIILITPLLATLISFLLKRHLRPIESLAVFSSCIQMAGSAFIAQAVIQNGSYQFLSFFEVDAFGSLLLLITSLVGLISVCYNIGYIRQEIAKGIIGIGRGAQSYELINLFLLAMLGAIVSNNPVLTWILIEATTLSTVFLISFYHKPSATEAAWKYLVINSVGLMLAFLGTVIYLGASAPLLGHEFITWHSLTTIAKDLNPDVIKMAFIFILIGYGTKLGIAPMHTWRPDAYSKAPIPVVAMLSGALLNIALLPILRFKQITDLAVGNELTSNLLIFFGILSVVVAAFAIYKQENYKRLLAYSSVEHAGIILLGFGFGGMGIYAGLLHMAYHSLAKSLIFLLSGNIFLKYSSTKIDKVHGTISTLPITSTLFILSFLGLTGLPPFGIFMSKFYIILAGINSHPVVTVVMIFSLALVFLGFFRSISGMIFGKIPPEIKTGEYGKWTYIPLICLMSLMIYFSLFLPTWLQYLLNSAMESFK